MTPITLQKRVSDSRLFDFDFSSFQEFVENPLQSIASATVPAVAGLTIGTPSIQGARVQVLISGGVAGVTYTLECDAVTSPGGYLLSLVGKLAVTS